MTCIKTGATVFFEDYGFVAPADLYQVGDTVIVRWTKGGEDYDADPLQASHRVALPTFSEDFWHRNDLAVSVVPTSCIIKVHE